MPPRNKDKARGGNGVVGVRIKRNQSPDPGYLNGISPPRQDIETKNAGDSVKNEDQGTAETNGSSKDRGMIKHTNDDAAGGDKMEEETADPTIKPHELGKRKRLTGAIRSLGLLSYEITESETVSEARDPEYDPKDPSMIARPSSPFSIAEAREASCPLDPSLMAVNTVIQSLRETNVTVINDNEAMQEELTTLRAQVKSQEANDTLIDKLMSRIDLLRNEISAKDETVSVLSAEKDKLADYIRDLEAQHDADNKECQNQFQQACRDKIWAQVELMKKCDEGINAQYELKKYHENALGQAAEQGLQLVKAKVDLMDMIRAKEKEK